MKEAVPMIYWSGFFVLISSYVKIKIEYSQNPCNLPRKVDIINKRHRGERDGK